MQVYEDGHAFCFSGKCGGTFFPSPDSKEGYESEYVSFRALPMDTIKKYDIKVTSDDQNVPLFASFPFPNGNPKFRNLKVDKNGNSKYYNNRGEPPGGGLFGQDKFPAGSSKYITLTEGEIDAASVYAILGYPAVSCPSGHKLSDSEWSYLNSFERIYFCFDADAAGDTKREKFIERFPHHKCYVVNLKRHNDVNDYLLAGDFDKFRKEWWAAQPYCPDDILTSADDFISVFNQKEAGTIVPTFIDKFNEMAYGLPTGHIVLIKGMEGLGKTEVLRKLAWHTFTTTDYSIATVFLEESPKRTVQGFASLALQQPVHLPDSPVPSEHVEEVARELGESGRINIIKMVDIDDNEKILNKIHYLVTQRECKYIFLDPVNQLAHTGGDSATRELDRLMASLEKMVVDLDFCLVITAHVNDEGLTRDSRMIQKAASIRIELERDHMNPDPVVKNTTHLAISKNRPFSYTGPCGKLRFDPATFDLVDVTAEPKPGEDEQKENRIETEDKW